MQVYTVTKAFDLTPLNQPLNVGDTVGKFSGSVLTTVNSAEYDNQAFYDWIGSQNSLGYSSLSGVVPDPSEGSGVPSAPVAAPATPTSTGEQGTWATDGSYMYWCVSLNTWVRWVLVTNW